MPRLYFPEFPPEGSILTLPENLARHVRVLRLQPGESFTVFDGLGHESQWTIQEMTRRSITAISGSLQSRSVESPLETVLLQSVSASAHMDWAIQKAVEAGVSRIIPVITRRSAPKAQGKSARWQEIAIAACGQCGRNVVPEVLEALPLAQALEGLPEDALRLVLAPEGNNHWRHQNAPRSVCLLVGAEGGLESAELDMARVGGFQVASLGPRILRTETAALAALATVQLLWGDWS